MGERRFERATLILSRHWRSPDSELSFVARSVAGAASRTSEVCVVVPGPAGRPEPDGAFDLLGAGDGEDGSWPDPTRATWPDGLPPGTTIVVDEPDAAARSLLAHFAPEHRVQAIAAAGTAADRHSIPPLVFTAPPDGGASELIRLHVPINPLAATHRHNGLGFTGYLLVLSDRSGAAGVSPPTPMVAWLTARFPGLNVVVVEDAVAAVWRGRALRGVVSVYTRTDLWRLVAHAHVTIDLAPGPIVARECVESLRFGTPIVVPVGSAAQPHADAGAGLSFTGYSELLACVARLSDAASAIDCHNGVASTLTCATETPTPSWTAWLVCSASPPSAPDRTGGRATRPETGVEPPERCQRPKGPGSQQGSVSLLALVQRVLEVPDGVLETGDMSVDGADVLSKAGDLFVQAGVQRRRLLQVPTHDLRRSGQRTDPVGKFGDGLRPVVAH